MPAHRKGPAEKRQVNSLEAARLWLGMGIFPVPLKEKSKQPESKKAWNKLRVTEDTLGQYFVNGHNLGGLWGEPSKWVVDIDLDWDEAADLAPFFLPETFIYGRTNRPRTHYLVRCRDIASRKWVTKDGGSCILEIRSTGTQSVLPPSIHPEGDRYEIDEDTEFAVISAMKLEKALDKIAAGAILLRNYPEGSGSRHDYVHAMAGTLSHTGWGLESIKELLYPIIELSEDGQKAERRRTVLNSFKSYKAGNRVVGWRTLSEHIDGGDIQRLKEWLTPRKRFETPPDPGMQMTPIIGIPAIDPKLLEVDGLVGDLMAWNKNRSYLIQPVFDFAVGLMGTAVASANNYVVEGWDTPLQPYIMTLAPSSGGKGMTVGSLLDFAHMIGIEDYMSQGFQSYYALLDNLAETQFACWLWDEAARHLLSARNPNSPDYIVISHLISLYGKANGRVAGSPGRKTTIPPLEHPFLTLMATAQPVQLIEAISSTDIATGFVNRLILLDAGDRAPKTNENRKELVPSKIKKKALALKQHEPLHGMFTGIKYDTPTLNTFREFEDEARHKSIMGNENEIWGRANQNALILAGIVAVGRHEKAPYIDRDLADWAIKVIRWSIACWMVRLGQNVSSNWREKNSKQVEGFIRRSATLAHRGGSEKNKKIMREGMMPRSVLMRMTRNLSKRELDEILDQLVEGNIIGQSQDGDLVMYWPKN